MNEIDGIPSVTHASGAEIVKTGEERKQRYLTMIDETNRRNRESLETGGERLGYLIGEEDNRFFVYDKPLPSEEMDELGEERSKAWYNTPEFAQAGVVHTRNNYLMITPDGYRLVGFADRTTEIQLEDGTRKEIPKDWNSSERLSDGYSIGEGTFRANLAEHTKEIESDTGERLPLYWTEVRSDINPNRDPRIRMEVSYDMASGWSGFYQETNPINGNCRKRDLLVIKRWVVGQSYDWDGNELTSTDHDVVRLTEPSDEYVQMATVATGNKQAVGQ